MMGSSTMENGYIYKHAHRVGSRRELKGAIWGNCIDICNVVKRSRPRCAAPLWDAVFGNVHGISGTVQTSIVLPTEKDSYVRKVQV